MANREAVILLHGMGRSWLSMALLGHRLKRWSYEIHLFGYRPGGRSLDDLTQELRVFVKERVEAEAYHFIGHSLGNIIVRNGFREGFPKGLSRIVMLAPPNHPPALATRLRKNRLYRWRTGDSGQKLSDLDFYQTLPVPTVEFGVIAGDLGHRFGLEVPNDGVVSVESTRIEGMKDFVLVHHTHTLIMMAADTAELCQRFLSRGSFTAE